VTRRVLAARLDNIGDVVLAGPAIRAVAASGAEVTLLCGPRGYEGARVLPDVHDVVVFEAAWVDPEPDPVRRQTIDTFVDDMADRGFDEAVILTSFHQNPLPLALLLRMAAVPMIGAISDDYPGSLLDVRHHVSDDIHEVERSLSLVQAMGYALPDGDDGALAVRRDDFGLRLIAPDDGPYVVLHPGASVPARAWSPVRYRELAGVLVDDGWRVVVTGGHADRDTTAFVGGGRDGVVDLGCATHLSELIELLAHAELLVCGNTGPAHLAAAVGTAVVSLYAPTVPAVRWHPWQGPHALLGDQSIACAGCRARFCPVPGHPCLESVTVDEVMRAVAALAPQRDVALESQS